MARIPLYEQQSSPSGIVESRGPQGGEVAGQILSDFGRSVAGVGMQVSQHVGQIAAQRSAEERALQAQKDGEERERQKLWAMSELSLAEAETDDVAFSWLRDMKAGGRFPSSLGNTDTFVSEAEKAHKERLDQAQQVGPVAHAMMAPGLLQIRTRLRQKLQTAVEAEQRRYLGERHSMAVDSDQKLVASSPDPQREFARTWGSWSSTLDAGLMPDNVAPDTDERRIWLADKERMREATRQALTTAAEQADMDQLGAETYLRSRGRDVNGKLLSSAGSRRLRDGAGSVAGGKWDAEIATAAAKHGVDPVLVEAVMAQESGGDPKAGSAVGARGLMQLMPETAAGLGVDPEDPAQNIEGGTRYLRQMLDQFGGDEEKALAAYNAGPATVEKAIASAGPGGDWKAAMRKHQSKANFEQTAAYVPSIRRRIDSRSEAVPGQAAGGLPPSWQALSGEEQQRWLNVATRAAQQERGAKRAELAEELRIRERNESNGEIVGAPLTFADYQAVYDDPEKARLRWEEHRPMQQVAQDMARLQGLPAQERRSLVTGAAPNPSDPHFDAKQRSWDLLRQANDRIDQQVKKDPFGYVMGSNREVQKAADGWNAAARGKDQAQIARARARFVAVAMDAQRAQGVDVPRLTTPDQEAAIVSSLTDPSVSGETISDRVRSESSKWGEAWPTVYRRISKDLPSDVDVLASGDLSEPAAALVGSLSRTPTKQLEDGLDKGDVREVRPSVTLALQPFYQAMSGVNPSAAFEKRERYADVAEKLAYHALQRGIARSPAAAADWASSQLLSRYEFKSSRNAAVSRDPATGSEVRSASTWMVPKEANPGAVDLGSQRVLQFAPMLLGDVQPPPDYEGAPGAYVVDVRRLGYWRNAGATEDGLVLMVAGAPVLRKDGSEFRLGWSELGRLGGSQFWSDPRMKQQKAALDAAMQGKPRGSLPFFVD